LEYDGKEHLEALARLSGDTRNREVRDEALRMGLLWLSGLFCWIVSSMSDFLYQCVEL
jgi:hypothetical protein